MSMAGANYLDAMSRTLCIEHIDWEHWLHPEEKAKVKDAAAYQDAVKEALLNPAEATGHRLPWRKADGIRFQPGEFTVWSGYSGSRKSMMLGFLSLGFIAQGATVCKASLEMKPVTTLMRMSRQFIGVENPTLIALEDFFNWCTGKLWLYDQVGTVRPERMIALSRYAILELDVQHMIIDSLMKCGIPEDDYNRQKWFIDELSTLAKDTGAHVHLVAHSRKPTDGKERTPSTKYSVSGSGNITNMADNVMIVHLNKDPRKDYDALLIGEKQRNGDSAPPYKLWFDTKSLQFKASSDARKLGPEDWQTCFWQ